MEEFSHEFEGKVRVRVCGLLRENDSILLLKHKGIGTMGYLWSPPGGGMIFGESAEAALIREFKEETGLSVQITNFLFVNEYREDHIHAIELFYEVNKISGKPKLGIDPELSESKQILTKLQFLTYLELSKMKSGFLHNAFRFCECPEDIFNLTGYFKFDNISK